VRSWDRNVKRFIEIPIIGNGISVVAFEPVELPPHHLIYRTMGSLSDDLIVEVGAAGDVPRVASNTKDLTTLGKLPLPEVHGLHVGKHMDGPPGVLHEDALPRLALVTRVGDNPYHRARDRRVERLVSEVEIHPTVAELAIPAKIRIPVLLEYTGRKYGFRHTWIS